MSEGQVDQKVTDKKVSEGVTREGKETMTMERTQHDLQ